MTRHDDHPDQHEHDLGLRHDMAVLSRRSALRGLFGAAGLATLGLAGCAATDTGSTGTTAAAGSTAATTGAATDAADCVAAAPGETAGPYPGDGSNGPNVLVESGVHRSDITTSFGTMSGTAEGVPMTVTMSLQDLTQSCAPGVGMAVYLWQCDREGRYSLYSDGVTDQNYLRGVQTADADGRVTFTSIFPGCYAGRWPHLHFEVYDTLAAAVAGENARLTSQIALPQDVSEAVYAADSGYSASVANLSRVSLGTDGIFSDGWDAQLPAVSGDPRAGYSLDITIGVASAEENAASGGAGGPGGGPGGPGGGPGGGGPMGAPPEGMSPPEGMAPPEGMSPPGGQRTPA